MNLFRRYPWLLLVLLSLAGIIASLTMVYIACTHPAETVPIEHGAPPPVAP